MVAAAPRPLVELVEISTVGLPFCGFKAIAGAHLVATQAGPAAWLGGLLLGMGGIDGVLNGMNAVTVLAAGARRVPTCVLHAALGPGRTELSLALDTMLAFVIVSAMILSGALGQLPAGLLQAWNVLVVLNVLGAGGLRLARALRPTA